MKVTLAYGRTGLQIELPDNAMVLEPAHLNGLQDEEGTVKAAFSQPIHSLPLKDRVKSSDRIAIVISDITRPTPNERLVPWILDEISHVPHSQIVIINGTGTHRDQTKDELVQMLGLEVVERIRVINHHCQNKEELSLLGTSRFGCEVWLNKEYVEADFRIVTGFIEPHFFAGFSGGPKGIMPGIAGLETIQTFHNYSMIGHPLATWGMIEGNPLQEMSREINEMCPPDFLINVALNGDKDIVEVFSGDWIEAHRIGCEYVKQHAMSACEHPFDVVITSNSGYPLDQNVYQAVKGMSAAHKIVKSGGTIICAAECSDGLPNHGNYAAILGMKDSIQEILEMISDSSFQMFDQWQVQKQVIIQLYADVYLYSSLPEEMVCKAKFFPTNSIEQTLLKLQKKYGENMTIAVLPQGPLTIPYIRNINVNF